MSTKFTAPPEANQEKKVFKVIPAGTHVARCVSWIDIGTHSFEWQGEAKTPRKVRIGFETPNETAVFNEEAGEQPFLVSTELTMSLHEKSNMFKMLETWIGFTEDMKKSFDPQKDMLGVPCLVTVKHEETKSGNTFAKITSVTPLMKGAECPEQVNPSMYFFMGWNGHASEFDEEAFEKLPAFIQDKIMSTPEYIDSRPAVSSDDMVKEVEEVFGDKKKD